MSGKERDRMHRLKRNDVLCFYSVLLLLFSIIPSHFVTGHIPSRDDVFGAINSSKALNKQHRDDHLGGDGGPTQCPMARFHYQGETVSGSAIDIIINDLIDAKTSLLTSYTESELTSINVTEIFKTEAGSCCQATTMSCDESAKYRNYDGRCNNMAHPSWGSQGWSQRRLLTPAYDDGFNVPRRRSVIDGNLLPNPRLISNTVHVADRRPVYSTRINLHVFQFGQFLGNDIIDTPTQSAAGALNHGFPSFLSSVQPQHHFRPQLFSHLVVQDCCKRPTQQNYCMPIRVIWTRDPNPFFVPGYCMNFARSKARFCPRDTGILRREQINAVTSFIDGSNIYGSSDSKSRTLRDTGGLLKIPENQEPHYSEACTTNIKDNVFCTIEGTSQLSVAPSLVAYHTLFVREHNRIAEVLRPSYSDNDTLFEETRRIVVAVMQKIVYDEFLPAIFSPSTISRMNLTSDHNHTYNETVNPSVANVFGIAYRLGHTWIPRFMFALNSDLYANETDIYTNDTDHLITLDNFFRDILNESSPQTDGSIELSARSFLFLNSRMQSFDLAAINIQRGRDHGLPSYTAYRQYCGLSEPTTFNQLNHHSIKVRQRLKSVYLDVRDIDLYTGALSEKPMLDGEVGPTLGCLLGQQFRRLKFGDRFWYQGEAAGFNTTQIDAIQQYTLSKVLCNNLNITEVNYPSAFIISNNITACTDIPDLDLTSFTV